jgi:hypothetical protein
VSGRKDVAVIGGGSAYSFDRLDLAKRVCDDPEVEFVMFERMSESTAPIATRDRQADPRAGYDRQLPDVLREFSSFLARGGKIVGSFGHANVDRAAEVAAETLAALGLTDVRIGIVRGDDVLEQALADDVELPELGCTISAICDDVISVNAYLGAEGIRDALAQGADVVIGGRLADHSLATGALAHRLGWQDDDWDSLAVGAVVGQLLQGGCGVAGGGFADPPFRVVPDLDTIGFPIIRVDGDELLITKPENTGGLISEDCIRARLFHEIFDPTTFLTPDVTLDLSAIQVRQVDDEVVSVTGARGRERPDTLRVLVGYDLGWTAETEVAIGGPRAVDRARLAEDVLRKRLAARESEIDDVNISLVGINSLFGDSLRASAEPVEVVLRLAVRARDRAVAEWASWEAFSLYWTAAGVGPKASNVSRAFGVAGAEMSRSRVPASVECI